MSSLSLPQIAGSKLRILIKENYDSQQEFADDYNLELRTVNRYINEGINKLDLIQELADFFKVDPKFFITLE